MKWMILTALWGVLMVGAFWKYEGSYLVPVQPKTVPYLSGKQSEGDEGKVVLLNFWNPDCACSEFAEPHVQGLSAEFPAIKIETVVICSPGEEVYAMQKARDHHLPGILTFDKEGKICERYGIPAAPAAIILDQQGSVAYRGSYNVGRFCDNSATAFAEQALTALTSGKEVKHRNIPFYGCRTSQAK